MSHFRRSLISSRPDPTRTKLNLHQLVQSHSSAIEASNQRESLLLERETLLKQRQDQHDQAVDSFRHRLVKL